MDRTGLSKQYRIEDRHPWRTAWGESVLLRSVPGRALEAALAIVTIVAAKLMDRADVTAILMGLGVVVLMGLGELVVRRVRGPYATLSVDFSRAVIAIEQLEQENNQLRHPAPLAIHAVNAHAFLKDEKESEDYLDEKPIDGNVVLFVAQITNQTAIDMSLDCTVSLLVKPHVRLRHRETLHLKEARLQKRWEGTYLDAPVHVPARRTVEVRMAFFAWNLEVTHYAKGPQNIADEGNFCTFVDRVTEKSKQIPFTLYNHTVAD